VADGPGDRPVSPLVAAEGDREIVPPPALDITVALGHEAAELAADPVEVMGGEDGGGAGREAPAPLAAEEPVEWDAGRLAGHVPQGHVEVADAKGHQPAVAVPAGRVAEAAPEAAHVPWFAAQDGWR